MLGPFRKTTEGKQHVVVIIDRYSKHTRAITTGQISTTNMVYVHFHNWIIPHGIPTHIYSQWHVVSKQVLRKTVHGSRHKRIDNNRSSPRNKWAGWTIQQTIVTRLCPYIANHQHDWGILVYSMTLACNPQSNGSTDTTASSLVLYRITPWPASFDEKSTFSTGTYYRTKLEALRVQLLAHIVALRAQINTKLASTQIRYKKIMKNNLKNSCTYSRTTGLHLQTVFGKSFSQRCWRRDHHEVQQTYAEKIGTLLNNQD